LISQSKACLLSPFTFSYKNFKGGFFKILIEKTGKKYFYNGDVTKFPFYWTNSPLKFNSWSCHSMKPEDLQVLSILDHLSRKLPTRALLQIYLSQKPERDFIGMLYSNFVIFIRDLLTLLNFLLDCRFNGFYSPKGLSIFSKAS